DEAWTLYGRQGGHPQPIRMAVNDIHRSDAPHAARGSGADDDCDVGRGAPAESSRPAPDGVIRLTAQDRVDDETLQSRVPGSAHLGGRRIHLRGGEGDLA